MKNEFSVFRDTEVKIFEYRGVSSYSSDAEMTLIKVISADLQPYSGNFYDKEFSLCGERRVRMFFSNSEFDGVKPGNYAEADGVRYRIESSWRRSMGAEAVLKEIS